MTIFTLPLYAGQQGVVDTVLHGEMIKLTDQSVVRLLGVDTYDHTDSRKVQQAARKERMTPATMVNMGRQSYEYLQILLPEGQRVRLEFDSVRRDSKMLRQAYVYAFVCENCAFEAKWNHEYARLDDGWYVFVNATMIKAGYAKPDVSTARIEKSEEFEGFYQDARKFHRGLWAD